MPPVCSVGCLYTSAQVVMCSKRKWKLVFMLGVIVVILLAVYDDADLHQLQDIMGHHGRGINAIKQAEVDYRLETHRRDRWRSAIHLAVVVCGDRLEESLVMLKSAVLFTSSHLVFHIFTETHLQTQFISRLDFWPPKYLDRIDYRLYNITFPADGDIKPEEWRKLFKPCACQRLFIPNIIEDVDSLIYLDTDVIILSPIEDVWREFMKFNTQQIVGLAKENENDSRGWYRQHATLPFYGETGVNSGVMLMNLTRLRFSLWHRSLVDYFIEYRSQTKYGDQDLINIYFHFFPDQLYLLSCEYNYRHYHCYRDSVCKPASDFGVKIIHGCARTWYGQKTAFQAVYRTFKKHRLGNSLHEDLLISLQVNLKGALSSNCGGISGLFSKSIEAYLKSKDGKSAT